MSRRMKGNYDVLYIGFGGYLTTTIHQRDYLRTQCLDIIDLGKVSEAIKTNKDQWTYLLDSLGSQHDRVVFSNTYAIFDTNANAPEVCRPSVIVGNVNATWIS